MKHRVKKTHLNRSTKHKKALFKNLTKSLFDHGEIITTQAKAKAVKGYIEKLITKAKKNTLHSRRQVHSHLNTRSLTHKLVDVIAPSFKKNSGYTRITRIGRRRGDNTMMVKLSLTQVISSPSQPTKKSIKSTPKSTSTKPTTK